MERPESRVWFQLRHADAKSILSQTSGFIARAGFSHSLNPARNCTYGCTYCYVPTMRIQAGLKPEDWRRWGQFTTFKSNAPELLRKQLRRSQVIYCSPLVDPYQPGEDSEGLMRAILQVLRESPPSVFVIQTRSPLVLRDIDLLQSLARRTTLRVSFSLTTNRDEVRQLYEPHCAGIPERIKTMRSLRDAGIAVYATLAPILPSDPEALAEQALECTDRDVIGDPFHVRSVKRHGATTRPEARRISDHHHYGEWHIPDFQAEIVERIRLVIERAGRRFQTGSEAFAWLSRRN